MFTVTKRCTIAAAHSLGLPYESKCNENHGHNFDVEITISADELNACGMVCDFSLIKEVCMKYDHKDLSAKPGERATSENLARWIFEDLVVQLHSDDPRANREALVESVAVGESDGNMVLFVNDLL